MAAKKKYYAIKKGQKTGIFDTWSECEKYVKNFNGAEYKSFKTLEEAEVYLDLRENENKNFVLDETVLEAYVDGSFFEAENKYSCGIVFLYMEKEFYFNDVGEDPNLVSMRNVSGELMGAVRAMNFASKIDQRINKLIIYHDYEGIAKWCTGEWKARLPGTIAYKNYYDKIKNKLDIKFVKVAAHTGNKYNEKADELAGLAFTEKIDLVI